MGQRVGECLAGDIHPQDPRRDPLHQARGEPERDRVERRIALRLTAKRVELGREVSVGPVGFEQRGRRLNGLHELLVDHCRRGRDDGDAGRRRDRARLGGRRQRAERHAEIGEHALVEAVLASEQRVDPLEEPS